jgi:hypothetical protein
MQTRDLGGVKQGEGMEVETHDIDVGRWNGRSNALDIGLDRFFRLAEHSHGRPIERGSRGRRMQYRPRVDEI